MKKHFFTHKGGMRRLIMLGIASLNFVWSYFFCTAIINNSWYAEIQNRIASDETNMFGFTFWGMLICAAFLSGVLLYWYIRKVAWRCLKDCFFAFFGWLPYLRSYDRFSRQEKEKRALRKEKRAWNLANPQIIKEKQMEFDDFGQSYYVYKEIHKNSVDPVKEETEAFLDNVLGRIIAGVECFIISVCISAAIPLVPACLACFLLYTTNETISLFAGTIFLLILFLILFIVQPIWILATRKADKEEISEANSVEQS